MGRAFGEVLERLVEADRAVVLEAGRVAQRISSYRLGLERGDAPSDDVLRDANAMRLIELGEAVKKLVRDPSIELDKKTLLTPDISADLLMRERDKLAHPDGGISDYLGLAQIVASREALSDAFQALAVASPEHPSFAVCLDALKNLSDAGDVSPTVWWDAGYYGVVHCGRQLKNLSPEGVSVTEQGRDSVVADIIQWGDFLAHFYERCAYATEYSPFCEPDLETAIRNIVDCLNVSGYRKFLLGERQEPKLEAVFAEWVAPEKGAIRGGYGMGVRCVVRELSRMAKDGASPEMLQDVDAVLTVVRRSVPEVQKLLYEKFPFGLAPHVELSLDNIEHLARTDEVLQCRGKTEVFSGVRGRLNAAATEVAGRRTKAVSLGRVVEVVPSVPVRPSAEQDAGASSFFYSPAG